MAEFFAELKRRQMFRVAAAYAVVAWLLLQLVNNLTPALRLPDWAATFVVVLLIAGFPVALLFCWIQHLPVDGASSAVKTRNQDWLLIGALALVLIFLGYQQIALSLRETTAQAGVDAAREAAASPRGTISVAVLPFTNLSSDPEQEFFSDGMTEEITSALARVPDLRVVARTSAYEFKGKNINIKTMGEQLGATHLIEGSVRKAGDRLRITAQLISAADGTHLWAQDYDRQLTDIFAIQEDIARAITASLHMSLGLRPGENLVNNRSIDSESYQQFLRARALIQARGRERITEASALLEQIVARNPNYAPAWERLVVAYYLMVTTDPAWINGSLDEARRLAEPYFSKMEAATRRAFQSDPDFIGLDALATMDFQSGNMLSAGERSSKALARDPNDPGMLNQYSIWLATVGWVKEANVVRQHLKLVEPYVPLQNLWTARYLWVDGQNEAALAILNALPPDTPQRVNDLAMIHASMGRYADAADLLEKAPAGNAGNVAQERRNEAARLLRAAPAKADRLDTLPRLGAGLDWVYLHVGAPELAIQTQEFRIKMRFTAPTELPLIWHSSYAPLRKTERFKAYVRDLGLVDYWRAKGWPEFCKPTTGDDFACN
jgi:TolB-like protein